jgi:hypothetical protein
MSLKLGQEVRVKSLPSSIYGEIDAIIPEPDGNDTVIVQISIRRRASDLELMARARPRKRCQRLTPVATLPSKAWEANPSDPNRVEALQLVLREFGWLGEDLPS